MAAGSAAKSTARVAAWAVVELHQALGPGRQVPPGLAVRTLGPGSPLGLVSDLRPGCTACGVCARTCPSGSLDLKVGGSGALLSFDAAACTGCGLCGDACPEDLLDVKIDTATYYSGPAAVNTSMGFGVHATNTGGSVDESRIALVLREREAPLYLTSDRTSHSEATEWLATIRRFLRTQGWIPLEERGDVTKAAASEDEPQFLVESDKSGKEAVHKAAALEQE